MKFFNKLMATVLGVLFSLISLVGCAPTPFEWKEVPPQTVKIGEELIFRDYLNEEEGASYTLYVSYTNPVTGKTVENEKQSSLIYSLEYATVYTFKVERLLKKKTATLEATVEALPKKPAFTSATKIEAEVGETKTFEQIFSLCGSFVTPSDLADKVKFESVQIEKAAYSATKAEDSTIETQTIAEDATEYTFANGALYTFTVTAENKSGKAELKIVVSTIDETKTSTKTAISYDARTKTVSWTAIEGATGYRVEAGTQKQNVTETSYELTGFTDGEYEVRVAPIYGDEIYVESFATRFVYVGVVKTALRLTQKNYEISWVERDLAESYTVKENGTETTLPATQLSYTLQGNYVTHDKVTVEVVANFNYEGVQSTSETASVEISYGTVTFKALDATKTSNVYKEIDGIEFIEIGDFADVEGWNNSTWIMTEFKGKNAPNVAVRATQGFNALTYAASNPYHSPAGILLLNSLIGEKAEKLYITRGFFSGEGNIDVRANVAMNTTTDIAPGIRNLDDDTNYIMILGYEHYYTEARPKSDAKVIAIYYSVDEDGNITEVFRSEVIAKSAFHSLSGAKTILYPNIACKENSEGITFTYYPAATSLADVVNNSTSAYKAALKAALSV